MNEHQQMIGQLKRQHNNHVYEIEYFSKNDTQIHVIKPWQMSLEIPLLAHQ